MDEILFFGAFRCMYVIIVNLIIFNIYDLIIYIINDVPKITSVICVLVYVLIVYWSAIENTNRFISLINIVAS